MAMKVRDLFEMIQEKMKEYATGSSEVSGDQSPTEVDLDKNSGLSDTNMSKAGDGNSTEQGKRGRGRPKGKKKKKDTDPVGSGLSDTELNAGDENSADPAKLGGAEGSAEDRNKEASKSKKKRKKKEEDAEIAEAFKAYKKKQDDDDEEDAEAEEEEVEAEEEEFEDMGKKAAKKAGKKSGKKKKMDPEDLEEEGVLEAVKKLSGIS